MRIAVWFGVRGEPSALRWMAARAEFALVWREVVGIGAALDAGGFCRRVCVDFLGWGGYTEGTYLGTFWAVRPI